MIFVILILFYLIALFFLYQKYSKVKDIRINTTFFSNKIFDPQFENVCKKALGHYPQLQHTKLQFITLPRKYFHASAFPHPLTLFFPRKRRTYIIVISTKSKEKLQHGLLHKLSEKNQIGIIGHELAHILDYEQKNFLYFFRIIYFYSIAQKRKEFERSIDILAIKNGFGPYLYGFYTHLLKTGSNYSKKFIDNYLSDDEILRLTKKYTGKDI